MRSPTLRWQASTVDLAGAGRARPGKAALSWRTIRGQSPPAYWPAGGTAAWHIQRRHRDGVQAVPHRRSDGSLEEECGLTVRSKPPGCGSRSNTTTATASPGTSTGSGPGEYGGRRDNVFTNLMAARNLHPRPMLTPPEAAEAMGVPPRRYCAWRDAADTASIPTKNSVSTSSVRFTALAEWDFEANTIIRALLRPVRLCPAQVIKRADLVLAMQWQSHARSRPSRRRAASTTTNGAWCATRRCRPALRR